MKKVALFLFIFLGSFSVAKASTISSGGLYTFTGLSCDAIVGNHYGGTVCATNIGSPNDCIVAVLDEVGSQHYAGVNGGHYGNGFVWDFFYGLNGNVDGICTINVPQYATLDGRYRVEVNIPGVYQENFYFQVKSGVYTEIPNTGYIAITQPTNGATTTSTSVDIDTLFSVSGNYTMGLILQRYGIGHSSDTISTSTQITAIGLGLTHTYNYVLDATSTWYATAYLENNFTGERVESNILFHVVAPSPEYLSQGETWEDLPCSVSDITGCFKKALFWAFVPPPDIFNRFSYIWEEIKAKPPIGYVVVTAQTISGVGSSSTGQYILGVPSMIQENIFDPIKTGFTWLLIVAFAFAFYHRLKEVQI